MCEFHFPSGWGGYTYVTDLNGNRIICPHPLEDERIRKVLGEEASWELIQERTGFNSDCVCLECLTQFNLDLDRDPRICIKCRSGNVRTLNELIDQQCPKCKKGMIREIDTGIIS
jgi:hypothetical protein